MWCFDEFSTKSPCIWYISSNLVWILVKTIPRTNRPKKSPMPHITDLLSQHYLKWLYIQSGQITRISIQETWLVLSVRQTLEIHKNISFNVQLCWSFIKYMDIFDTLENQFKAGKDQKINAEEAKKLVFSSEKPCALLECLPHVNCIFMIYVNMDWNKYMVCFKARQHFQKSVYFFVCLV